MKPDRTETLQLSLRFTSLGLLTGLFLKSEHFAAALTIGVLGVALSGFLQFAKWFRARELAHAEQKSRNDP